MNAAVLSLVKMTRHTPLMSILYIVSLILRQERKIPMKMKNFEMFKSSDYIRVLHYGSLMNI